MNYLQDSDEIPESGVLLEKSVKVVSHLSIFSLDLSCGHVCKRNRSNRKSERKKKKKFVNGEKYERI